MYLFEPSVLEHIPAGRVWSAEHGLFPDLVSAGARLFARGTDAYWMDIGTPQKYLRANLDALAGRYRSDAVPHPREGLVLAADGATVARAARVSSACLGARAVVEEGATVLDSVLLPGASVERQATVVRSILGEGARVRAGARVEDAALADDETV